MATTSTRPRPGVRPRVRRGLAVAALALVAAGCGGEDSSRSGEGRDATADDQASSASPTPTAAAGLAETCPDVAAALQELNRDVVITQDQAVALRTRLQELADAGDDEVRNAVALLLGPTETFAAGGIEPGLEYIDAEEAFDGALLSLDDRCRAAGSPILG